MLTRCRSESHDGLHTRPRRHRPNGFEQLTHIVRLIGVYDADGSVRGELAYWIGARLGRAHCSLCEITHGLVRERADWKKCRAGLAVPFDTYHRDEQPDAVRVATADIVPAVIAETQQGFSPLLGPADLDRCGGSVDQLFGAIERAVQRLGLAWPEACPPESSSEGGGLDR